VCGDYGLILRRKKRINREALEDETLREKGRESPNSSGRCALPLVRTASERQATGESPWQRKSGGKFGGKGKEWGGKREEPAAKKTQRSRARNFDGRKADGLKEIKSLGTERFGDPRKGDIWCRLQMEDYRNRTLSPQAAGKSGDLAIKGNCEGGAGRKRRGEEAGAKKSKVI